MTTTALSPAPARLSMRAEPRYPALYQINTRVWLSAVSQRLGRPATLDDAPDAMFDRLAELGFDWVWMLSVWRTGEAGRRVSLSRPEWLREYRSLLPDFREDDVVGSGFAVSAYSASDRIGGDDALARLRARLAKRGLKLMLDFVPNHTALDHPWVDDHPEYYVSATEIDLARAPGNYTWVDRGSGRRLLAFGRDPNFPGWPDTLQLNYAEPAVQAAMAGVLEHVAERCDGVRCDMAMLALPEIFERTWGRRPAPFWSSAIERVKQRFPRFVLMAEVYWDLEWAMLQQGFDYAYDKRLYDRLRGDAAGPVRDHLRAGLDYQDHLARFLENHDEPRAASIFPYEKHRAAAAVTFLTPGLRFFQHGQFDGWTRRIPTHLGREPVEGVDEAISSFYGRLMGVVGDDAVRSGAWELLDCLPAWEGNPSNTGFIAFSWRLGSVAQWIIAVNYAPTWGQCYVRLETLGIPSGRIRLADRLSEAVYFRDGAELRSRGLYLDAEPWRTLALEIEPLPQ
jgi:hypothetical protein